MGAVHEEEDEGVEANRGKYLDIAEVEGKNGEVVVVDDTKVRGEDDDEGGWDLEDLELPAYVTAENVAGTTHTVSFVTPSPGMVVSQIWIQKYSLAGEHATTGNFDTSMRLLSRQLGIKNFTPLKPLFLDLYTGSHTYLPAFVSAPVVSLAIKRGWTETASPNVRGPPALVFRFSLLDEKLRLAYRSTIDRNFSEALRLFLTFLHTILVIFVDSRREVDEVKELIGISK